MLDWFFKWAPVLGSVATAVGVFLAWLAIRRGALQARTDFEDDLAGEYRKLAREMPPDALLGGELRQKDQEESLRLFYNYVDLSNEQTFLRKQGRVSKETWLFWCEGIKSNLERPAFKKAWDEIRLRAPKSFEELRRLESRNFTEDPNEWN